MAESLSTYAQMSDRQLVISIKKSLSQSHTQQLEHILYTRYKNFVHKHWHALTRQLNSSALVQDVKEDFYSESYVSFSRALAAIDITKIRDENWKFLGYLGFYLSNQRNTFAKKIIKKYQEETPIEVLEPTKDHSVYLSDVAEKGIVLSAEDEFLQNDQRRRFWLGLNYCKDRLWGGVENQIFNLREQGKSIKAICDTLDISPWKFNKLLNKMKNQLDRVIETA